VTSRTRGLVSDLLNLSSRSLSRIYKVQQKREIQSGLLQYWNFEPRRKEGWEYQRSIGQGSSAADCSESGVRNGCCPLAEENSRYPIKMPSFALDEAHKLAAFVSDEDAAKMR